MTDEEAKQAEMQAMIFTMQAAERKETGKRNIVIYPEFISIYEDEDNDGCCYDFNEDGSLTFYNKDEDDEININIPGFQEWRDEYYPILFEFEANPISVFKNLLEAGIKKSLDDEKCVQAINSWIGDMYYLVREYPEDEAVKHDTPIRNEIVELFRSYNSNICKLLD